MRRNDVIDDQRTRWFQAYEVVDENADMRAWRLADQGGEVHMFADDVQMGIMPYSMTEAMRIDLQPADDKAHELVAQALGRERGFGYGYQYHRFEQAVPDFVRECSQTIIRSGQAQYELVTERNRDTKEPLGFRFQWVTPHTIRRRRGRWVQDIGTKGADEMRCDRYVPIDITRIVTLPVIPPLTPRKLLSLNRTLAGVGTQLMPFFGLNSPERPPGFDFGEFQLTRSRASAAATAPVGWNGRGRIGDQVTDYYYLYRELRFQRFLVELRASIIDRVNHVLAKLLPRFGCRGSIVLSGFPGVHEIETIAGNLERGTSLKTAFHDVTKI
jgi:hypothetical protein